MDTDEFHMFAQLVLGLRPTKQHGTKPSKHSLLNILLEDFVVISHLNAVFTLNEPDDRHTLPASSVLPLFPYQFMLIIIIIIILICYHKRLRHRMFFLSPDSLGLQNPRLDSPAYGIGMSCQSLQSHQKRQSFGSHRKRGVDICFCVSIRLCVFK